MRQTNDRQTAKQLRNVRPSNSRARSVLSPRLVWSGLCVFKTSRPSTPPFPISPPLLPPSIPPFSLFSLRVLSSQCRVVSLRQVMTVGGVCYDAKANGLGRSRSRAKFEALSHTARQFCFKVRRRASRRPSVMKTKFNNFFLFRFSTNNSNR